MTDSESEIVMKSALTKKKMKAPTSPTTDLLKEAKKLTTKEMIVQTLTQLNSRKGASVYAIKKHVTENFEVNSERISYLIKKTLKIEVEKGTIVQVKGIGASGSFRLAPIKTLKKLKKPEKSKEKKIEKETKKPKDVKEKKVKKMTEKTSKVLAEKKSKEPSKKKVTEKTAGKAETKKLAAKKVTEKKEKNTKSKMASVKTPAKNRPGISKRKSIGSIIKKPKMKPKSMKAK